MSAWVRFIEICNIIRNMGKYDVLFWLMGKQDSNWRKILTTITLFAWLAASRPKYRGVLLGPKLQRLWITVDLRRLIINLRFMDIVVGVARSVKKAIET
jgi:hypothetical protein